MSSGMLLTVMDILLYFGNLHFKYTFSPFMTGLSVIQKCNPEAILVAHEKTMHRISRGYIAILISIMSMHAYSLQTCIFLVLHQGHIWINFSLSTSRKRKYGSELSFSYKARKSTYAPKLL